MNPIFIFEERTTSFRPPRHTFPQYTGWGVPNGFVCCLMCIPPGRTTRWLPYYCVYRPTRGINQHCGKTITIDRCIKHYVLLFRHLERVSPFFAHVCVSMSTPSHAAKSTIPFVPRNYQSITSMLIHQDYNNSPRGFTTSWLIAPGMPTRSWNRSTLKLHTIGETLNKQLHLTG